jgi:hypothetical protein
MLIEFHSGERLFLFGRSGTLDALIGHRSILGHGLLESGEGVVDHVVFVGIAADAYRSTKIAPSSLTAQLCPLLRGHQKMQ